MSNIFSPFSLAVAALAGSLVFGQATPRVLHSGTVPVPGGQLYYEAGGNGQTVILLHGGLLDLRMWDDQFDVLVRAGFRVIRYDARGHGRSSPLAGDYCHYEDLHAFMTGLGIRRATLVGLSLGGRTAIDFALAYPDMVEAIVAVSPGMSGWDFDRDPVLKERVAGLQKIVAAKDLDAYVEWFQQSWTDGPDRAPSDVNPAVRERVRVMAKSNVAKPGKGKLKELDAVSRIAEVKARTLAVLGDLDMASIHGIVDLICAKVPGARKVVIQGAAHMVNMEKPEEFNRILLDFLRSAAARD